MTKSAAYIGVDQGTSSTKAVLTLPSGEVIYETTTRVDLHDKGSGQYEQDPEQILSSICEVLAAAKAEAGGQDLRVAGVGFAFQRSGVTAWEKAPGTPVHPLISWRDTRTQDRLNRLNFDKQKAFERTGIPSSSNYAGGKISLLQEQFPSSSILVGTLDTFIFSRLLDWDEKGSRPFLTEDTMAHRTMLYSFEARGWDEELCSQLQVKRKRLARISPTISELGTIESLPVRISIGDQQASLLGVLNSSNRTVLTLGSIASLVHFTGSSVHSVPGYISSIFCSTADSQVHYFTEGTVNCCAETVARIETLGVERNQISELCAQADMTEAAVVGFCPFGNTTTPDWEYGLPNVIPRYAKLSKAQITMVLIQNLAHFVIENINTFRDYGLLSNEILVTGGVANVDYLLQYIADGTGETLKRMRGQSGGAKGVALAATFQEKLLIQDTIPKNKGGEVFIPIPERKAYVDQQIQKWQALRGRVRVGDIEEEEKVSEMLWEN